MQIGLILDIILVALVVMIAFISAKKGFLLLILDIAAGIASFILARMACTPVAQYIYDNYLQEAVLAKTTQYATSGADSVNDVLNKINEVLVGISPTFDGLINRLGFIPEITNEQTATTAQSFESAYLAPLLTGLLTGVALLVIAVILLVVLRIVARILDKVIVRKPLKKINESLGWVLGFIKGVIPVFIIACIFVMVSPMLDIQKLSELVDTSYICKLASMLLERISL